MSTQQLSEKEIFNVARRLDSTEAVSAYLEQVCGDDRVVDIIGGLHLQNPSKEQMEGTVEYLGQLGLPSLHACHCTDLKSKIALSRVVDIKEVGVGLKLSF